MKQQQSFRYRHAHPAVNLFLNGACIHRKVNIAFTLGAYFIVKFTEQFLLTEKVPIE